MTPAQQVLLDSLTRPLAEDNPWLSRAQAEIIAMWAVHAWNGTVLGRRQFAEACRHRANRGETWGKLPPEAQRLLADLCDAMHRQEAN